LNPLFQEGDVKKHKMNVDTALGGISFYPINEESKREMLVEFVKNRDTMKAYDQEPLNRVKVKWEEE
jgi:hypothetical protein